MDTSALINSVVTTLTDEGPHTASDLASRIDPTLEAWQILTTLAVLWEDGQVVPLDDGALWAMADTRAPVADSVRQRRLVAIRRQHAISAAVACLLDDADATADEVLASFDEPLEVPRLGPIIVRRDELVAALRKLGKDAALYPADTVVFLEDHDEIATVIYYDGVGNYWCSSLDDFGQPIDAPFGGLSTREERMHPWLGTTDGSGQLATSIDDLEDL